MSVVFKKISWQYLAVVLVVVALVTTTVFSLTTHGGLANAQTINRTIGHGQPFTARYGGTVDLTKLPTVAQNSYPPAHPATQVNRDLMTPAQRAAYEAWAKKNLAALPHAVGIGAPRAAATAAQVAQNAANFANPDFDVCGYAILGCVAHTYAGQNSTQDGGAAPGMPDQAIASNPSYVLEGNNNILSVYNFNGTQIYGPVSTFSFFSGVFIRGDFLSNPQVYWDATRQHWIVVEIEHNAAATTSYVDVAVSKTQNATLAPTQWYEYQINHGSFTNTFCEYVTLGSDYWGIWVSCMDFPFEGGPFMGNTVYGLNKNQAYSGGAAPLGGFFYLNQVPNGLSGVSAGPAQYLSPVSQDGTADAEFLIATAAGFDSTATNVVVTCAFTFTHLLEAPPPNKTAPTLSCVTNTAPLNYVEPFAARESGGIGTLYPGDGTKQLYYIGGTIYLAMTTATSNSNDGIWWAQIQPQLTGLNPTNPGAQVVNNTIFRQNNIVDYAPSIDAFMPSIIGSSEDDMTLVYNYSGTSLEPGIVYTNRRATDAPNTFGDGDQSLYIIAGSNPNGDGFWGDNSACSLDTNLTARGLVWCAGEYGGPHSSNTTFGWDTYVYAIEVE